MAEFDLIERIRARVAARADVRLGIGDDAALLAPPPGHELAFAADTLNAGIHFPPHTDPVAIGWKALAVNLSDLAAMGARPAWCSLSLSLPEADAGWLDGFLDGFFELAGLHELALVGGDTTRGPLSLAVSVIGLVEAGSALQRAHARAGDEVWVSGHLGDAAAALAQWQAGGPVMPELRTRLERPQPRIALGRALRGLAHACIDLSDGLVADLGHICRASGLGARIEVEALPCSPALAELAVDAGQRLAWQVAGGDDYELCFSAPPQSRPALEALSRDLGLALSCIGAMVPGSGVQLLREGRPWQAPRRGFEHFTGA
ncbi:thiamine-phosphate kinase [Luteimonas sp. e5]